MFLAFPPMPPRAKRAGDVCSVFRAAVRDYLFLTCAINAYRRRIHKLGPEIGVRACARGAICILSFAPVTAVNIRVNKLVENFRFFYCNVCNLL
jgi:hypothetical protein